MLLPIALIAKSSNDEYLKKHVTIESAAKHAVSDMLQLLHDIKILREIELTWQAPPGPDTKQGRYDLKRSKDPNLAERVRQHIIEKDEKLQRLLKNCDYTAMTMAAYPEAQFVDRELFWDHKDTICQSPVLLRGISSNKIIKEIERQNQDWYFIETGYLGNYKSENNRTGRKIFHRIVKNAMQHDNIMDVPNDRYQELVKFNPAMEYKGWRKGGSKILVVLPTDKPFQYYGEDREAWIKWVENTIRAHSDREIVWREKTPRAERTNNTIYDALDDDIHALVTYNSVAAVEAIQAGIPAFALAPTAAAPLASNDLALIEDPPRPSETLVYKWLCSIAYGQFSLEEIISGRAWRLVLENQLRPIIEV
jgi:hypothetical protein